MRRRELMCSLGLTSLMAGCLRLQASNTESSTPTTNPTETAQPDRSSQEVTETARSDTETQTLKKSDINWPQYGYDSTNTAHVAKPVGPKQISNKTKLKDGAVDGAFVLREGELYTGDQFVNRGHQSLLHKNQLYISGTGDEGKTGKLYAFNLDGERIWETTFEPRDDPRTFPNDSPTAKNETVYQVTGDGSLFAINANDGTTRWRYNLGFQKELTPAITSDTVFITSDNMTAALTASGEEVWTQPWGFTSSPVVENDKLYVFGQPDIKGSSGNPDKGLYALSTNDGSIQWSKNNGALGYSGMRNIAVDADIVYTNSAKAVYAYQSSDGTEIWRTQFNSSGEVCLSEDTIYAIGKSSGGGAIKAFDKETGDERWGEFHDGPIMTEPVLGKQALYLGTGDGLYKFE